MKITLALLLTLLTPGLSALAQGTAGAERWLEADGLALAAIQGLNQKLTQELKRRDAENAELKQRLERLEALLSHRP